jgi:hypothetical protein
MVEWIFRAGSDGPVTVHPAWFAVEIDTVEITESLDDPLNLFGSITVVVKVFKRQPDTTTGMII